MGGRTFYTTTPSGEVLVWQTAGSRISPKPPRSGGRWKWDPRFKVERAREAR
jgi:hypothetical protein